MNPKELRFAIEDFGNGLLPVVYFKDGSSIVFANIDGDGFPTLNSHGISFYDSDQEHVCDLVRHYEEGE